MNKENPLNISYENKLIDDFKDYNSSYEELEKGVNNPTFINNKMDSNLNKDKLEQETKRIKKLKA